MSGDEQRPAAEFFYADAECPPQPAEPYNTLNPKNKKNILILLISDTYHNCSKAAEAVLQEGESLSAFIESSLRTNIERRLNEKEFIARGLASRDRARQSNSYVDGESVIGELRGMLEKAGKRSA